MNFVSCLILLGSSVSAIIGCGKLEGAFSRCSERKEFEVLLNRLKECETSMHFADFRMVSFAAYENAVNVGDIELLRQVHDSVENGSHANAYTNAASLGKIDMLNFINDNNKMTPYNYNYGYMYAADSGNVESLDHVYEQSGRSIGSTEMSRSYRDVCVNAKPNFELLQKINEHFQGKSCARSQLNGCVHYVIEKRKFELIPIILKQQGKYISCVDVKKIFRMAVNYGNLETLTIISNDLHDCINANDIILHMQSTNAQVKEILVQLQDKLFEKRFKNLNVEEFDIKNFSEGKCAICHEEIEQSEQVMSLTNCQRHASAIHKKCLQTWLKSKEFPDCPICKTLLN